MIIIGLTGSVGMGKTEAGKFFKKKEIDVFDCDAEIASLYKQKTVLKNLKKVFPTTFINEIINKEALAKIVFNDKKKLTILEKILHEKLNIKQSLWLRKKIREKKKVVVFDVPLLFEKNNLKKYDFLVVVSCAKAIQKRRVLKRKYWNLERLKKTLNNQFSDEKKKTLANFVIKTDRGKRYLYNQIINIIKITKFRKNRTINNILKEF